MYANLFITTDSLGLFPCEWFVTEVSQCLVSLLKHYDPYHICIARYLRISMLIKCAISYSQLYICNYTF